MPAFSARIVISHRFWITTPSITLWQIFAMRASSPSPTESTTLAPYFASGSALARVRFHTAMSQPPFARRPAISKPMRPVPIQPSLLVGVGNGELLSGVKGNDGGALRREDHFFFDARGRDAVSRRAVGLHSEHHARLQLDRLAQRREPRDQRALVQPEAEAVAKVKAESVHLAREADVLRFGQRARDLVGRHPGSQQLDRLVHPLARLLVSRALRACRAPDVE